MCTPVLLTETAGFFKNFMLFPKAQKKIMEHFQDIQKNVISALNNIPATDLKKRFETLYRRCEVYIDVMRDYFEK